MSLKILRGLAVGSLLLALVAAGCTSSSDGGGASGSGSAGAPRPGGTLHVVRAESFDGWVGDSSAAYASFQTESAVIEPLVRFSSDGKSLEPGIATSWTYDPAALTWTFTLREGVVFSDGTPLTSADVAFAESVWAAGFNFGSSYAAIKTVETPDPLTVVFVLSRPDTTIPVKMSCACSGVMPKDFGGRTEKAYYAAPIGAGAFVVDSWSPAGQIVLSRNPNYYDAPTPVRRQDRDRCGDRRQ